jgi:23S rRNA pseudouridine1911/1915/1917 synthase
LEINVPIEDSIILIPEEYKGKRLDQAMAELYPAYSRSRLQEWIKSGFIKVNNQNSRQREILHGGEEISIAIDIETEDLSHKREAIPLDFIHTDNDIIVLNKPTGLVVHPGAGNPQHTLLNALLYHIPELERLPRAGIVQRLDKDTSGIMVIARSLKSHTSLVNQLQNRTITREYQSVVQGVMTAGGKVDAPIGRHPVNRKRMAIVDSGKQAITHYKVIKRFSAHSHIQLRLESGRTHQIRVHMEHIRHHVVGDPVYSGRPKLPKNASPELIEMLQQFPHQALHASRLELVHPLTGSTMSWQAPLPSIFTKLLTLLEENA